MTADVYPNVYIGFSEQENEAPDGTGGSVADADFINHITDTVYQLELMVGLAGDSAGSIGHEARIKTVEAKNSAKITQSPTSPVGAVDTDLWINTTIEPWEWNAWNGTTWVPMGANAVQIQGTIVDAAVPTNGQVLTYDSNVGKARWQTSPSAIGFANPMTLPNEMIIGGTAGAATRLAAGNIGQYLAVSSTGVSWSTPPFISLPVGATQGDFLWYNGSALVRLGAGNTGQFLKMVSNTPVWSDLPSSPAGSAIVSPPGAVIGSILEYDGTNWVVVLPGLAGQFWRTNGTGQRGSWANVTSGGGGFANPMTNLGDIIIGDTGGAAVRLPPGALGKVLKMTSTTPSWQDDVGFANPMTTANDIIVGGVSGAAARLAKGSNGQVLLIDGSGNVAWATLSVMTNPMTTVNDLVLGGASGAPTRLPKGANNAILGVDGSGNVVWRTLSAAGILSNPMTTKWDIIMADTGGTPVRLPLGGLGQVLSVVLGGSGNELGWSTPSGGGGGGGGMSNPMTTAYDLIVGGTGGTPVRLPKGSNGYVLTINGSGQIVWAAASGGMTNPMTTAGDIIYGGSSGTPTRLGIGTDGEVLTLASGVPAWVVPSGGGGGGSTTTLTRMHQGLIFYDRFGGVSGDGVGYNTFDKAGSQPWVTVLGAWSIDSNGRLTNDGTNYATIMIDTPARGDGVIEYGFLGSTSVYHGGIALATPQSASYTAHGNIGSFFIHTNQQLSYKNVGDATTNSAANATASMTAGQAYRVKHEYMQLRTQRDTKHNALWLDNSRLSFTNPHFNNSQGYNNQGLVGLQTYGGSCHYDFFAYYSSRFILAWGLTGTQSLAVVNAAGTVVASGDLNSGANQGRVAIDSGTFNCPMRGHYQVFTDNTNVTAVSNARFPADGELDDICGGDRLILS